MQVSGPPAGTGFVEVVAGSTFGVARRTDGSLVSWGGNLYGQVSGKPAGTGFIALAAGPSYAIALRTTASAQWSVTNLHPAGSEFSEAYGIYGGRQVGRVGMDGVGRATLWTGTAASRIDLHPPGATGNSAALGVNSTQQVGEAHVLDRNRASLWSDTAASWVSLHPRRHSSFALGAHGGQQVGVVYDGFNDHASLWSGTKESWVDLHPVFVTGAVGWSHALAVHAGQQVGYLYMDGSLFTASLWTGTADSWVGLNPAGAEESFATGVYAGQQVGHARFDGVYQASLWNGTADSWVSLHPLNAVLHSFASGIHGGQQVGNVDVEYVDGEFVSHASVWSGTAASWVDLHSFLPPEFSWSQATGIWHDENGVAYVVGFGYNSATERTEALLWTAPQTGLGAPVVEINGGEDQPGGATIEFSNVTTEGQTTVTASGTGPTVPAGFNLVPAGTFYDISTTAQFTGTIEVCLNYNQAAVSDENNLKLMHFENGAWKNVTTSLDTLRNVICGTVTSLSPFIIVETGPPVSWSGVLQPVNADNSSVFKAGSTMPVKFRLTEGSAGITDLIATLSFAKITEGVAGEVNEAGTIVQASTDNRFRFADGSGQYVFNWSTSGLAKGTYRLYIDLGDGVEHTVEVGLK